MELKGKLRGGVTATDMVLTITEMLRREKVVGKFVEFCGEGTASLSVAERATIGNMAPEYGATMGFFPVDERTIDYFRGTGRTEAEIAAFEAYFKAQKMFGVPKAKDINFTKLLTLDLSTVAPSLAGPKRPQDRIEIGNVKNTFIDLFSKPVAENGFNQPADKLGQTYTTSAGTKVKNGDILIAAITSCTNTSNPSVLLAAGLLAKKAVEAGLTVPKHIKTSLAPGSRVVTEYLTKTGLLPYLEKLGFDVAAYGCTTCIGNAGDLTPDLNEAIIGNDLVCAAVLSGNRNFEARIHPNIKANFLASPPLVVAYALAGTITRDLMTEPVGQGKHGDVWLGDIWPSTEEIDALLKFALDPKAFQANYGQCQEQPRRTLGTHQGRHRRHLQLARLDLHRRAAVLPGLRHDAGRHADRQGRARAGRVRRLGHHRPHLAGRLHQGNLARRQVAQGTRRDEGRLQQLRLAPRQPRDHDARHLRQRAHQEPHDSRAAGRQPLRRRRDPVPAHRRTDVHL